VRDRPPRQIGHGPGGNLRDGPHPGEGAVVDARRAVHGIDRLWVADASVMSAIPAANTNLTTIVIAERITQGLQAHHQGF
jgi:choline dehydrogenase